MELNKEGMRNRLGVTIERCRSIWANQTLRHYTKHGVEHSEHIKRRVDEIVPLITPPLSDDELFVLLNLNAIYLHDIGMQHIASTCKGKTVDQLDADDYERIREAHNIVSATWIRESVRKPSDAFDALGLFNDDYLDLIADVSAAHTKTDIATLSEFVHRMDSPFRLRLLAALLIIGDELDLSASRVDLDRLKEMPISTESKLHWWKHHYVDRCWVEQGHIKVRMAVPVDYDGLIARSLGDLATKALRKQLAKDAITDVLARNGIALQLDQPGIDLDAQGRKQPLPPELAVVSVDEIRADDIDQLRTYVQDNAFPGAGTHVYGMNVLEMTSDELRTFLDVYVHLLRTIQDLGAVKLDITMRLLGDRIDAALPDSDVDPFAAEFIHHRARMRVLGAIERSNRFGPHELPETIDDEFVWERMREGYERGIAATLAGDDPAEWSIMPFEQGRGQAHIWLSRNRATLATIDRIVEDICQDITIMVVGTNKLSRTLDPG
ncbi:MAG: hypothetical protein M3Y74_21300, partial [Chloroflexota bacterium]|nr:hypothetical protein [Chloroflexota bacterium]